MKKILLALVAFATTAFSAMADNIVKNGGFESWTEGVADNWKSTTTASNATVADTTEAHSGSHGIVVRSASANKRLASCEYNLKPGTYTLSAFVKGGTQARIGYAPSKNGTMGSYVYADVTATSVDTWTDVTYTFTLDTITTVNFVMMVPKNSGDIVVDDYTVTTTDGGIAEDAVAPEAPEATGDGTLEKPYNAIAANEVAKQLASKATTETDCYIKGIISSIKYTFSANYGTATFYISEDGKNANTFLVYSAYYLENQAWVDGDKQIEVGDEVIVCGKIMNYNGTYETASKQAYIYSLNGLTGVNNATVSFDNGKVNMYSIDGRKVSKLVKGINIVNGKKVLVK